MQLPKILSKPLANGAMSRHSRILAVFSSLFLAALLLFHLWLIHVTVHMDYDTISIIWSHATSTPSWGNIAHPFLSMILWEKGMDLLGWFNVSLRNQWTFLLSFFFLLNTALLLIGARLARCGRRAILLFLLYLLSPITLVLSRGGEENLIYHGLFFLSNILFFVAPRVRHLLPLCAVNVFLGLYHLQPFVIIIAAQSAVLLVIALGMIRSGAPWLQWRTLLARATCAVAIPSGVYILITKFLVPIYYSPWHLQYRSFFTAWRDDPTLMPYIREFFENHVRWMIYEGFGQAGLFAGYASVVGGLLAALMLLYIALNLAGGPPLNRSLSLCALCAYGFVFLYEPLSPERWDTFFIALITLLVLDRARWRLWIRIPLMVLLLAGSYHSLTLSHKPTRWAMDKDRAIIKGLQGNHVDPGNIYFDDSQPVTDEQRFCLVRLPSTFTLRPLGSAQARIASGRPVFLAYSDKNQPGATIANPEYKKLDFSPVISFGDYGFAIYRVQSPAS